MLIERPKNFEMIFEYGLFNEIGDLIGLREDAPEEVKEAWQKLKAIYDEAEARGEKL